MGYVGNQTTNAYTSITKQDITGNGGTAYTLDHAVANVNEIEVFVNNVRQEPSVAYTVSGTALTMTGNVAASDDFYVVFQGKAVQTVVPPDDSVTTARINDDAVTSAKIADDAVVSAAIADDAVKIAHINEDFYKTGTFTPTAGGSGTFGTTTYSNQFGRYVKVGSMVTVWGRVEWTANSGGTSSLVIGNLPFDSASGNDAAVGSLMFTNINTSASVITASAYMGGNTNYFRIFQSIDNGSWGAVPLDTAGEVRFTLTYETDE